MKYGENSDRKNIQLGMKRCSDVFNNTVPFKYLLRMYCVEKISQKKEMKIKGLKSVVYVYFSFTMNKLVYRKLQSENP
jgi:hypothetical protein